MQSIVGDMEMTNYGEVVLCSHLTCTAGESGECGWLTHSPGLGLAYPFYAILSQKINALAATANGVYVGIHVG